MNTIKIFLSFLMTLATVPAFACKVCEENQPGIFKGITHGVGPTGNLDFIIVTIATVIVIIFLILSIKYIINPGEKDPDHIKNIVVDEN